MNIHRVDVLYKVWWKDGSIQQQLPTLEDVRNRVQESLGTLRKDHLRHLYPTPYKVEENFKNIFYLNLFIFYLTTGLSK